MPFVTGRRPLSKSSRIPGGNRVRARQWLGMGRSHSGWMGHDAPPWTTCARLKANLNTLPQIVTQRQPCHPRLMSRNTRLYQKTGLNLMTI